jgi:5-hydroxyisourate hydrolase
VDRLDEGRRNRLGKGGSRLEERLEVTMGISTHILDTSRGRPAAGVTVTLERRIGESWNAVVAERTDADGRVRALLPPDRVPEPGTYRLRFDVGPYFAAHGDAAFYPTVEVVFLVGENGGHYHVPLLLSPFGYSTYRGS